MSQSLIAKDIELFHIVQKHGFENSKDLLEGLIGFFEVKQKIITKRPIESYLRKALEAKSASIIKKWKSFQGGKKN